MISMDKRYKTRGGREVRVLCTDAQGKLPVVGLVEEVAIPQTFDADGHWWRRDDSHMDLIEVKPERTVWVNIYTHGHAYGYPTKEAVDKARDLRTCIACVQVTFRDGDGLDGR